MTARRDKAGREGRESGTGIAGIDFVLVMHVMGVETLAIQRFW